MKKDEQGRTVYKDGTVSSYFTCPTCRKYTNYKGHRCGTMWLVIDPDEDEENIIECGQKQYAYDAELAAEDYLAEHFSDMDYPDEADVIVADQNGENITYWNVTVEAVPEFTANKLDKRPE